MNKIGILGGTFNPIHLGHLAMAKAALMKLKLNAVIFVPSCLPPHKSVEDVIDAKKRLAMVKLVVKGNSKFRISRFEIKKGGRSYSINTVKYLRSVYGSKTKFYFIIGQDSFTTLGSWKNIPQLLKLVTFVVVNRPGVRKIKVTDTFYDFKNVSVTFITSPALDISSSYIRAAIAKGKSVKYLLPESVFQYIEKKRLYR